MKTSSRGWRALLLGSILSAGAFGLCGCQPKAIVLVPQQSDKSWGQTPPEPQRVDVNRLGNRFVIIPAAAGCSDLCSLAKADSGKKGNVNWTYLVYQTISKHTVEMVIGDVEAAGGQTVPPPAKLPGPYAASFQSSGTPPIGMVMLNSGFAWVRVSGGTASICSEAKSPSQPWRILKTKSIATGAGGTEYILAATTTGTGSILERLYLMNPSASEKVYYQGYKAGGDLPSCEGSIPSVDKAEKYVESTGSGTLGSPQPINTTDDCAFIKGVLSVVNAAIVAQAPQPQPSKPKPCQSCP